MALALALDVNRYGDFCRGVPEAVQRVRSFRQIVVPFVVVAELRAGFRRGTRSAQNERTLIEFLGSEGTSVAYADDGTTKVYAEIYDSLRKAGKPIPRNDLWIAALAIQHDLILFTRDRHFAQVPRLATV